MSLHILSLREFGSCLQGKAALVHFFFFFNSLPQNTDAATGTPVLIRSGTQALYGGEPPPRNREAAVACPPVKVGQWEQGEPGAAARSQAPTRVHLTLEVEPHTEKPPQSPLCAPCRPDSDTDASYKTGAGPAAWRWEQIRALSSISAPREQDQASSKF